MIVLCSSPRSGGNWLLKELSDRAGIVGKEYLSKDSYSFIEDVRVHDKLCAKIHPSEVGFDKIVLQSLLNLFSEGHENRVVWLERFDVYAQAESLAGARATGQWFNGSTRGIVEFGQKEIDFMRKEKMFWYKNLFGVPKYKIIYENMLKDIDAEMKSLLNYLEDER